MRIACVGGGPAGLYFGILASQLGAGHDVTVYERFPEGVTYGWGVVFWDDLLDQLGRQDLPTAQRVRSHAVRWEDQVIDVRGREPVRIPDHGYSMARQTLLRILADRARELGVRIQYGQALHDFSHLAETVDLVVASDGVNSAVRGRHPGAFGTDVVQRRNKYIWLGTSRVFGSFTFPFVETDAGWVWAHAYGFDGGTSTFVVETSSETWRGLGFDRLGTDATMRRLEAIFAPTLEGHALRPQHGTRDAAPWLQFQSITNARWHAGRLVLMGDAAHTTHFTIGSGTRLALQDAMALADTLAGHDDIERSLEAYGRRRRAALRRTQRMADSSATWFEHLPRYVEQDRFADLLQRRFSAAQSYLPTAAFLRLSDVALSAPGITVPARKAVQRLLSLGRNAVGRVNG
jgi:2-polyprenyl-6-methoxyphenol hydroxylase-like FAD-dependent oxidoreductase